MEYKMGSFNKSLPNLIKKFPSIICKDSVDSLLSADKYALSFEDAKDCMALIDIIKNEDKNKDAALSTEGHSTKEFDADFETKNTKDFLLEESTRHNFANVKFNALIDYAKQEDTFLYTEFNEADAARNRIASEVVSKYENDFNSFLMALKTAEGVNKTVIDSLIQTKIHVGELN
jgi:6-pyruvoyl-tetrahydropterin synthase